MAFKLFELNDTQEPQQPQQTQGTYRPGEAPNSVMPINQTQTSNAHNRTSDAEQRRSADTHTDCMGRGGGMGGAC